ncbi:MAG: hypothetical protein V8S42_00010 [Lachnospiraceae bacterium]
MLFRMYNPETGRMLHCHRRWHGESGKSELGDFLFAGRNGLKTVKFPASYGINGIVNIPSGTFRNCTGLECVDFTAAAGSTVCGNVGFDR